jgi:hypothetical protein
MTYLNMRFLAVSLYTVLLVCSGCNSPSPPPAVPATPATRPATQPPASTGAPIADSTPLPAAPPVAEPAELAAEGTGQTAQQLLSMRAQLDRQLWSAEVDAQRHEEPFIRLWDALRTLESEFTSLKGVRFQQMRFARPQLATTHPLQIQGYRFSGESTTLDWSQWLELLGQIEQQGYRLAQSEWHHSRFQPASEGAPAESTVSFVMDLRRDDPARRVSLRGNLNVTWSAENSPNDMPQIAQLELRDCVALVRDAEPVFREILSAETNTQFPRLMPLLLYDLDGNGASEIILGGLNRIYWNDGRGNFRAEPLCASTLEMFDAAVIGDFNGDSNADLLCVGNERVPLLLEADDSGRFINPARKCANFQFELPKSFTAGDIDGDGDLDVWIGQYKFPYLDGSMPTPYYDSNDGYPSVMLENDGKGNFREVTEAANLSAKRNRRTYSSSLVDLDEDHDLDLMTVNDFCGVDVYENNGRGLFADASDRWLSDRHLFGMGHTLADYDLDGHMDMYLIGMSSTTARRLDRLNLGRADHPDVNAKRQLMGYGNRMLRLQRDAGQVRFEQAPWNDRIARTGWSWGTTSFDFDNDGDVDIYVANGHNSGQSARDYCTRYWCHDVYTGSSQGNPELLKLFGQSLRELHEGQISWNGFEHKVLWMNLGGQDFINVAFLLGVGFEFDGRAVASDDLDNDGRRDLLVVRYVSHRAGHAEYKLLVLRNELQTDQHWIGLRLSDSITGRSPVGARVTITTTSGKTYVQQIVNGDSFSTQHAPTVHFGLGDEAQVQQMHVRWQDGTTWSAAQPQVDAYHSPETGAVAGHPGRLGLHRMRGEKRSEPQ